MGKEGFTLIETILGLALLILLVSVVARNVASVSDLHKQGQLIRDIGALQEAIRDYYVIQGVFPDNISDLSGYLPAGWTNESPFGYDYYLSVNGSVARIETMIPDDTINLSYLPNTYTYTSGGTHYVYSEIVVPRQNFNARWERKHIYGMNEETP